MSTRKRPAVKAQPVRKTDNLTAVSRLSGKMCEPSTSSNLISLHGLLTGIAFHLFTLSTILKLYSEVALSWKPYGIRRMYSYNFVLRMTHTVTFQNISPSS
jgi:hypothetical protein